MQGLVQILSKRVLKAFWERKRRAETPLRTWFTVVSKAQWNSPADVKAMFGGAVDFVADNRVIFDLGGNKYRLVVRVAYPHKRVLVKFVGTHKEYDAIAAEKVGKPKSKSKSKSGART